MIERQLSDMLTWSTGSSRQLMLAQYTGCDELCADRIEAQRAEAAGRDVVLEYTYWRERYRSGRPEVVTGPKGLSVEQLESWPRAARGHGYNLLGAALIAQARPEEALEPLGRAEQLLPERAAPSLNALRAHQMLDQPEAGREALDRANTRELEVAMDHLGLKRRDVNSFVRIEPLPTSMFWSRHRQANDQQVDLIARFWPYLAGQNIPLGWSMYLGGVGLALVLLTLPLPLRGQLSTPCPSCGLARDPSDGATTGDHPYCKSCYRSFVTGASMNFQARVYTEEVLGRRRRLQAGMRRVLSALLPGAGHALAGWAVAGTLLMGVCIFGLLLVVRAAGLWRAPGDLLRSEWLGAQVLAGCCSGWGS